MIRRLQHPWWVTLIVTFAVVWTTARAAELDETQDTSTFDQANLIEVTLEDGHAVEVAKTFSLPDQVEEPELVIYVPATLAAKSCVFKLLRPILNAGDRLQALNVVTVLDLTHVNAMLRRFVRSVYRGDREDNPSHRVRFWIDESGQTQGWWHARRAVCAYTLYHPQNPPLAGAGAPTRTFIGKLLRSLERD